MPNRKRKAGPSSRKKSKPSFDLTRVKLLYGLTGIFTLCVVGLLAIRPAPLAGENTDAALLAAKTRDPLETAIRVERGIDANLWKSVVVERIDSLASASFHFAVIPQPTGDQIAISAEWSRQAAFSDTPGELRIALISDDSEAIPQNDRTIRLLAERLRSHLRIDDAQVTWR